MLQYNNDASEFCIGELAKLLGWNVLQRGSQCYGTVPVSAHAGRVLLWPNIK